MLDSEPTGEGHAPAVSTDSPLARPTATGPTPPGATAPVDEATPAPRRRRAASRPAGPPGPDQHPAADQPSAQRPAADAPSAQPAPAKRATRKRTPATPPAATESAGEAAAEAAAEAPPPEPVPAPQPARRSARKRASAATVPADPAAGEPADVPAAPAATSATPVLPGGLIFRAPDPAAVADPRPHAATTATAPAADAAVAEPGGPGEDQDAEETSAGRRRRRGGRGRRGRGRAESDQVGSAEPTDLDGNDATTPAEPARTEGAAAAGEPEQDSAAGPPSDDDEQEEGTGTRRRRRRRRRTGGEAEDEQVASDDPPLTVTRVRAPRKSSTSRDVEDDDEVRSVKGSTRLEAKKQRRREGREAVRRRPSVITEAEFLARRESVDRRMIVRQVGERSQIAVLEDDVLVEHYVGTASGSGLTGNVYLGRVQNVLPSMEAAFVDIGKGRNAVLYAGEVNWDAAGLDGQPRRIELALKAGDPVLVQVTKDPIGHKGARLTSQVSLAGRYLVLVPGAAMTGISRKLPDTERSRLKAILRTVVPDGAGVIVRTAAEGASEQELSRDVARLTAQWADIEKKSQQGASAPALLYAEPDMTIRVVRDIFNEDFAALVVSGDDAWDLLEPYVGHVAPDLRDRMSRWTAEEDVFTAHRVDEQLAKALDRKVWLPSGGYLVIDRTEAMVVVDVNTGKFTGAGGNLEETVTKNNLEAAEEIVRQLRLRDLGGIIVIDFIDMVLESNRDLVLRRLLECLGRDRTRHQVAEVTSLGLVQMTRKRVGQGLHEVFAEPCEACNGRGYHIHPEPVTKRGSDPDRRGGRGGRAKGEPTEAGRPKPSKRTGRDGTAAAAAGSPAEEDVETAALDAADPSPAAGADPVETGGAASIAAEQVDVEPVTASAGSRPRRRRAASSPAGSPAGSL